MNVASMPWERARTTPEVPALIDARRGTTRALTFAELDRAAAQAARLMSDAGLRAGDAVLMLQPVTAELYVALLALLRRRMVAMFVDPGAGRDDVERCCRQYPPRGLIASRSAHWLRLISPAIARIPIKFSVGGRVPGAADFERYRSLVPEAAPEPCAAEEPALITFTSGSTGAPKAALRTHGLLAKQHAVLERCLAPTAGDALLTALPMFVLSHLASGVTTVLPDADLRQPGRIEPAPVVDQLARHGVNRIVASPALLERILSYCEMRHAALNRITTVFTGGAPVFPGFMRRLQSVMPRARIVAVYGSTEAEPIAHIAWDEIGADDRALMLAGNGLLAGHPVPDIELRIMPPHLEIPAAGYDAAQFTAITLGPGEPGEIVVSGPHVLGGYLNGHGDRETKFRAAGRLWHRTGDVGYRAADGRLWLLGRAGTEIHDGRGSLYPYAVECAAQDHPAVRRAALATVGGRRVLLVEPFERIDDVVLDEIGRRLRWADIDAICALRSLPVDRRHNSKIDYSRLQRWLRQRQSLLNCGMRPE